MFGKGNGGENPQGAARGPDHILGGGNTQKTLPFGTPEEVRAEVLERCETFAPGGGFVFNAIHNVQALTPTQNVVAMIEAVHSFNGGVA
jgi:uroporphyrinogen-III decarboxylase